VPLGSRRSCEHAAKQDLVLLNQDTLAAIADGRVTLQFRCWKRPTVRAGGTLLTSIGQLAIDAVDPVELGAITEADARGAGFADRASLVGALARRGGVVYRVALRLVGPDPRIALRASVPGTDELAGIAARLERWDRASPVGPWTETALALIAEHEGVRAGDLAEWAGMDRARFKSNVRKLKGLGLTESLEIGYRLSPRGAAVRRHLGSARGR
jgi:hypothetical protein